jgi:hypothetical protein
MTIFQDVVRKVTTHSKPTHMQTRSVKLVDAGDADVSG